MTKPSPIERAFGLQAGEAYGADEECHTRNIKRRHKGSWKLPPSPDRWKERSRTFPGIAQAMAQQWTEYIEQKRQEFV